MKRIASLVVGTFLLCAAHPPEPPPLPEQLKPYVKDGQFDPGDFGWMRGYFSDASPADKLATDAAEAWLRQCMAEGSARTKAELAKMGIVDPKLDAMAGAALLCRMYVWRPLADPGQRFAQFQAALGRAMPLAETYLVAIKAAKASTYPTATLSSKLLGRPLAEQMLRRAWSWGRGEMKDAPALAPQERALFVLRLGMATTVEDHANTEWLKNIVAEKGWPKKSEVGEGAAREAWLLVQHADADPAFQLQVLRLMEPLVSTGEVEKSNYAYLYDRVMLKLNGKQRYASQMRCDKGKRIFLPLEDETALERYRAEMDMPPIAEYLAQSEAQYGACPAA